MNKDIPVSTSSLDDIPEEFLLPEQRLEAITDILASITKKIINKHHDNNSLKG